MKISVIGAGYVGLVASACFASFDINVTCIDNDPEKIKKLNNGIIPIHEPSLEELVANTVSAKQLSFAADYSSIHISDVIILAVGTPSNADGSANLDYLLEAVDTILTSITSSKIIIIKSTVPIGTAKRIMKIIAGHNLGFSVDVISNPEFLREGSAIFDFLNPDRIVIGASSSNARDIAQKLYATLSAQGVPILTTDNTTAEVIKYSANAYLAMRVAFINECSDIAESCGANITDVAMGMGLDHRVGKHYLQPGPGYGGSCFPKDTKALSHYAKINNVHLNIIDSVIHSNDIRKINLADRAVSLCIQHNCRSIAILGVTFKSNTDDMRDSSSIPIVAALKKAGIKVAIYDPSMPQEAIDIFNMPLALSLYEAVADADAAIILTEWDEFKEMDLSALSSSLQKKLLIDYRNLFAPAAVLEHGLQYHSLGR